MGLEPPCLPLYRSRLTAAGRDYFFKALAARSLSIGEPVVSRTTNAWTCIISRPVMSPENDVLALVYVAWQCLSDTAKQTESQDPHGSRPSFWPASEWAPAVSWLS